ncbi:MAG: YjbF family lipoprotein [Betaproteobacteria bacterium]
MAVAVMAVCALSACTPAMDAAVQTVQKAVQRDTSTDRARLNPNFSYLRITLGGRVAFLALGGVDPHPDGPVEVWYSALREVVRTQNGRVVGVTGFKTEWRNVSVSGALSWGAASQAQRPQQWVRIRDVMPGYRYGVRDELELNVIVAPARSELKDVDPHALTWFEERMRSDTGYLASLLQSGGGANLLPVARYAVDLRGGKEAVIYAEQCIAPDTCFTWQRWSAEQQNKAVGGR